MSEKAWLYFAPIYYDIDTQEVKERGLISGILLEMALGFHNIFVSVLSLFVDYEWTYPITIYKSWGKS